MSGWTQDTRNRLEQAAQQDELNVGGDFLAQVGDDIAAALAELDRLKTVADAAVGSNVLQGERHASACKFLVGGDPKYAEGIFVSKRRWHPEEWWAVERSGRCLNKSGEWEWEPMPSSRDDAFFARTRWPSAEEAIQAFREAKWKS